ncbi:MAG: type I glyceraldehyde-3-phosphate dehydrogenase [Gammaproteobacteria bacterium]
MTRIAINGFGRIGRALMRALYQHAPDSGHELVPVAINDPYADSEQLALLLQYDSLYGHWPVPVELQTPNLLQAGPHAIRLSQLPEPAGLPWRELEVDTVFECSGQFHSRNALTAHLKAGAKRVILSHPGTEDLDATIVYGINHAHLDGTEKLLSAASCTSNCLAPVLSVLHSEFGIEQGSTTTLHAAMNDQPLLDSLEQGQRTHNKRLMRSGINAAVPVATKLADGVERVIPELKNRLISHAFRLPHIGISAIDMHLQLQRHANPDQLHNCLNEAAQGALRGILTLSSQPLISTDFLGNPHSAIVDTTETQSRDLQPGQQPLVRLLTWFDNEWAFACRMLDLAHYLG